MTQEQVLHIVLATFGFALIALCEYKSLQYKQRIADLERINEKLLNSKDDNTDATSAHMAELRAEVGRVNALLEDAVFSRKDIRVQVYEPSYAPQPMQLIAVRHGVQQYTATVPEIDLRQARCTHDFINHIALDIAHIFTKALHDAGKLNWVR